MSLIMSDNKKQFEVGFFPYNIWVISRNSQKGYNLKRKRTFQFREISASQKFKRSRLCGIMALNWCQIQGCCMSMGSVYLWEASDNTGFGFGICLFHQPLQMRHVSMSAVSRSILIKA